MDTKCHITPSLCVNGLLLATVVGKTVYYSQKEYGEHKVVKWDEDKAEFLLDLDGQKFWSNPFKIQICNN